MNNIVSLQTLMQKPICLMSGEEFAFLVTNIGVLIKGHESERAAPSSNRRYAHSIEEIAEALGCSKATVNRMKKRGDFDGALYQNQRTITLDLDKALEIMAKRK